MAKVRLGAKFIADRRKASTDLEYTFIPDIEVEVDGETVPNKSLKGEAIKLRKRYLTEGERTSLMFNVDSSMPMERMWDMTVLAVENLDGDDGKPLAPSDITNAVGSSLASSLILSSYMDSLTQSQLNEEEEKN